MRIKLLIQTLLVLTLVCSTSCKESSEVKPLAEAKTITERLESSEGVETSEDGQIVSIPIKISLTQNTLSRYDIDDILNGESNEEIANLPAKRRSWLKKLKEAFQLWVYNNGLRIGLFNSYRYTTSYDGFPELDTKYIKSVKMKKLFFAIEPCDDEDVSCQIREKNKQSTLMLLDKFFLNISVITKPEDLDFLTIEQPEVLGAGRFNDYVSRAWGRQPVDFNNHKDEYGEISEDVFYDLNVAKYDNRINNRMLRKMKRNGNLRDNGKNFIARIQKDYILEAKKFFSHPRFDGIVKDKTFLGKSLFIELYSEDKREEFFKTVNAQQKSLREVGVFDITGCTPLTCTEIKVNPINLVPMLEKSTNIKFDTYFSVKELDNNDFRYSGFIEIEVKLKLPL